MLKTFAFDFHCQFQKTKKEGNGKFLSSLNKTKQKTKFGPNFVKNSYKFLFQHFLLVLVEVEIATLHF
jgi:hypothetical protein